MKKEIKVGTVAEALDEIERQRLRSRPEPEGVAEDRLTVSLTEFSGAHALLKAVYLDDDQPLSRRIRCAIAAIPYEVGKLTASTPSGNGRDFAAQLEKARKRSREALTIEHQPQVQASVEPTSPMPSGFRRL
jgi:hypothetical protein